MAFAAFLSHHQPDRVHDHGAGNFHPAGPDRGHLLHYASHHCEYGSVFGEWYGGAAGGAPDLKKLGGLIRSYPILAVLFLIPALSLWVRPPLSGFFSKFVLIGAGLESEQYLMVAVSLFVSVLTLFSMMKIWNEAFWKPRPESDEISRSTHCHLAPIG